MSAISIPLTRVSLTSLEETYLLDCLRQGRISGDGPYTKRCHAWLEQCFAGSTALLTHSCTAALEMAALLADLQPGDEVIMPSFTFVSTANAFVLRGAIPVFVDIRPDTLNLDENLLDAALTARTRAVVPVHYAGVACEMDTICAFAKDNGLMVVEDAAQGHHCAYRGRPLGGIGDLGALSFHATKNIVAGEGGALLVNREDLADRSHVLREKGTNRVQFLRGEVGKYEWLDIGSSFLPSDLVAAVLLAQFERADDIMRRRRRHWASYHAALEPLEMHGWLQRPVVPDHVVHGGHIYYVLLQAGAIRTKVQTFLREAGIEALFHYVPLHSAPAGLRYGRCGSTMEVTERTARTLLRLPMSPDLEDGEIMRVVDVLTQALKRCC
jgi:dTDP-4-amino-4,6-dideoxygalactose transaminase